MATKRTATTELNHDNWNEDIPAEEAGTYQVASNDEIKRRVFKTAKRRLGEDSVAKPFSGFSGFNLSKGTSAASGSVSFDFLKSATPSKSPTNGHLDAKAVSSNFTRVLSSEVPTAAMDGTSKRPCVVDSPATVRSQETGSGTATTTPTPSGSNGRAANPKSEYLQQLRDLNEGVVRWIADHVATNPNCILTPVFDDYERHLRDIQAKRPGPASEKARLRADGAQSSPTAPAPVLVSSDGLLGKKSGASLWSTTTTTGSTSGTSLLTSGTWPATSFAPVNPAKFSFGSSVASATSERDNQSSQNDDTDDYEPPKNLVSEIKEEDAVFSVRCKLFYKKGSGYSEKGVGTLYVKSTDGTTQLLVRAETSLGNVLLNIRLTANLPSQRVGKNNVTLVCVPSPPIDPKGAPDSKEPVTFLIRVKDGSEADLLLETLQKYKT